MKRVRAAGWSVALSVALVIAALAVGALLGCSSPDPSGSRLNRPEPELNEAPKPKQAPPKQQKPTPPKAPTTDAGAPDSSAAPPPPPTPPTQDGGAPDTSVPQNKLVLASVAPMTAAAGSGATTLTVTGSGFGPTTKVMFGAINLATTNNTPTSLTATIPASALTAAGNVDVRVANGADTAGPVSFTISNTVVTLTALTPSSAAAGSAAVAMKVSGTGFISTATVRFNGAPITTTYTSATELNATIPATSLATAGTYPVTVAAGTAVSAPLTFTVQSTKPIFESFSPGSVTAGSPTTTVQLFGRGFTANTKASVNGYVAPTTVVSSTQARVSVDAFYLRNTGVVTLRVYQDTGGPTAVYADGVGYLDVEAPAQAKPTFTSMTPTSAPAGSTGRWLTITGSGFKSSTGVSVDGYVTDVIVDGATQVRAYLYTSDLATAKDLRIRVYNDNGDGTAYYADADGTFEVY
jgi:hypothetical protein